MNNKTDAVDGGSKVKILHLTGDYPDPVRKPTTKAIQNTINHLPQFDHVVISMDRKANPFKCYWVDCGEIGQARVFAFGQWGLKFGIGLFVSFFLVALKVRREMRRMGYKPDVIHAHRMTFDGIAAYILSKWWKVPYVLSVRAEVESKVFRFKPHYKSLMAKIAKNAAAIYYVSLFYRKKVKQYTGADPSKGRPFPNIVTNTSSTIEPAEPRGHMVAIFNFSIFHKKGIDRLLPAFRRALKEHPDMRLDLIGSGSKEDRKLVRNLVLDLGIAENVTIVGQLENRELVARLKTYKAMVLPSHNETFGMVYTEALFAGVPILYSRGTGIDGYLDGLDVGVGVDPTDKAEITAALIKLWQENDAYRANIAQSADEIFKRFDPTLHLSQYEQDILRAVSRE